MPFLRQYSLPIAFTVILHVLVLLGLSIGFAPKTKVPEIPTPKFISANVVQLKQQAPPTPPAAKPPAQQKQEQQKQEKLKQEKLQQEKAKQERLKQEKIKQDQAAKQKAEQEKQRQQILAKERAEKERLQQEKTKQEQQRKEQERLKQEALAQKAREEALLNQIAEQETFQQQQQYNEQAVQSYAAIIEHAVISNWSRPASARNGMEVLLEIQLIPNGTVVQVNLLKSSGNDAFDRSAIAAVKKAERFPDLAKLDLPTFEKYFRRFNMRFKPEDLRL
jgi:colicin import membrane protein